MILALVAAVILGSLVGISKSYAADLGGTCCSDLEERVAELEAITAKKGNRKLSLTISGQINADYTYVSLDGFHDGAVSQNGNNDSYLRVSGSAPIMPDLSAGFVLELDIAQLGVLNTPLQSSSQPTVRQSFWYLKSDKLGTISVGRQAQATNFYNNPNGWSTNSAWLAGKPLSFGSLSDLYLTGLDVPFDGDYSNSLKYVSPDMLGFTLSATWSDGVSDWSGGHGNNYDVALRYDSHDKLKDFHVMGAVGYRHSVDWPINLVNIMTINVPTGDVDTVIVNGSALHIPTGLFVNGEFVNQDWAQAFGGFTLKGYDVTGGVHEKWIALGPTEAFGSWGRVSFDQTGSPSTDIDYYGLGATQAIDAAAMTLYAGWKHYNTNTLIGTDVDAFNAGAVVNF